MQQEIQQYRHQLPTIAELQQDLQTALQNDKLNYLLNQPVPKEWVKKNKFVKVKNESGGWVDMEYLPIDKIEYLLLRIFGRWRREIISITQVANSVMAIVRLWVWNPVYQDWDWHDGVGAVAIQQDAGASATDIEAVKKNAIQIGAPAAVSFALKNAAKQLGEIFGKNLSENNTIHFSGTFTPEEHADVVRKLTTEAPTNPLDIKTSF